MSRELTITHLRSIVAIADTGGFGRAATRLHVSQSTVSQHIRLLEKTIGRPVVEREGRGPRFTTDGEQLLGEARRILAVHDDALARLEVRDCAPARLQVGARA
ncbi:MAG: LysR family transcriptional regulator [Demequina sp.]|nr:LysR family transcriptional regulator [Demequina sp.]